jgi:hypothetical protein
LLGQVQVQAKYLLRAVEQVRLPFLTLHALQSQYTQVPQHPVQHVPPE